MRRTLSETSAGPAIAAVSSDGGCRRHGPPMLGSTIRCDDGGRHGVGLLHRAASSRRSSTGSRSSAGRRSSRSSSCSRTRCARRTRRSGRWSKACRTRSRTRACGRSSSTRSSAGPGYGQLKLGLLNEILGRYPSAPQMFGAAAPDTGNMEMLAAYGTEEQKERWLEADAQPGDVVGVLDDRAAGRLRPEPVQDPRRPRRRRVGHQRREVVHRAPAASPTSCS